MQTKITYATAWSGVVVAGLTITEIVSITVGLVSVLTMMWAAYANHKRNKRDTVKADLEHELLRQQIENGRQRRAEDPNE